MSSIQNVWLTIFNFGPAIYLGISKTWWVGIFALVLTFILSWVTTFLISFNLSEKLLTIWAWTKPPLIATIILSLSLWLF